MGSTNDTTEVDLPVLGLPGKRFYIIHISALVSINISNIISIGVLIYALRSKSVSFWKRSIGERLTIYIAVLDLVLGLCHGSDHSYMLITKQHVPEIPCTIFAYLLTFSGISQSVIVMMVAILSFICLVKEKKITLGRYDWKILLLATGIPFTLVTPLGGLGILGPTGAWCFVDMRKPSGPIAAVAHSIFVIVIFSINIISYLAVWIKIQRIQNNLKSVDREATSSGHARKAHPAARTTKTMSFFVAAYLFQWCPLCVYFVCTLLGYQYFPVLIWVVIGVNMGGGYNAIAYTLVKRRQEDTRGRSTDQNSTTVVSAITEGNLNVTDISREMSTY